MILWLSNVSIIPHQTCLFLCEICITITAIGNKNVWLHLQLQEVFTTYKKERVESDKGLTEQSEKLQEQLSDLRSQNAKISTQLEFASKR